MTTYLVTRHEGTRLWAYTMKRNGRLPFAIDDVLDHLSLDILSKGDIVIGTLPVHMVATLNERGVKFWSLDMDVPPDQRGKELTSAQLQRFGARFTRYEVKRKETEEVVAAKSRAKVKQGPSITLIPVSEQLAPAAIGWLHEPTDQVCLLASPSMARNAKRLKAWLEGCARPPSKTAVLNWDDADYRTLLQQAEDLAATLAEENRSTVVLNLTGGTKLMAMALQRAFGKLAETFEERLRMLYVDTAHNRIEHLSPKQAPAIPMRSVLNITDLLKLNGIEAISAQSAAPGYDAWLERGELFDLLLSEEARKWLPTWNLLANTAADLLGRKKRKADIEKFATVEWDKEKLEKAGKLVLFIRINNPTERHWSDLGRALNGKFGELLVRDGIAAHCKLGEDGSSVELEFKNKSGLDFISGSWLEVWLASKAKEVGADDWVQGLQVKHEGVPNVQDVGNEFDLIVASGNRMLVIEAKTANMGRAGGSKASDTVYKLDSLADKLGRYFNKRWLVSLRPLEGRDRDRAGKHKIDVYAGEQAEPGRSFADLDNALNDWVATSRLQTDACLTPSCFLSWRDVAKAKAKAKAIKAGK